LLHKTYNLWHVAPHRAVYADFDCGFEFLPAIEVIREQMALPVECPVVGILKYPHFQYALARVKVSHRSINIEKDGLHNLLSFTGITYDSEGNVEDESVVAIEQDGKSFRAALAYSSYKLLVRQLA
jgi:hypothetical protein